MAKDLSVQLSLVSDKFQKGLVDAGKSLKGVEDSAFSLNNTFNLLKNTALAIMGGGAVISILKDATAAYMEQETAINKMSVAMKNQGDYSKASLDDMVAFSGELQKTTAYADEAVLAIMANLKSYGMLNSEVKLATEAALDFATAKKNEGMTIEAASELIGKAYLGQTERLARYGVIIDESKDKAEKFDDVIKQLNERFGGAAAAELETYAGQIKNLGNQWGEVKEDVGLMALAIGTLLIPSIKGIVTEAKLATEGLIQLFSTSKEAELDRQRMKVLEQIHAVEEAMSKLKNATMYTFTKGTTEQYEKELVELNKQLMAVGKASNDLVKVNEKIADGGKRTFVWTKEELKAADTALAKFEKDRLAAIDKKTKADEKYAEQVEKDRIAEIKLVEKVGQAQIEAYGDYEDLNADRSKLDAKRTTDFAKENDKQIQNEEKKAADLQGIYRQLYDDIDDVTQDSFDFKVDLLDKEAEANIAAGASMGLVMDAYEARWNKLHEDLILSTGTFADGLKLGLDKATEHITTWASIGVGLVAAFKTNAQSALSGFLSDALSGDIAKFSTYWNTFKDAMIDTFADMLAQLAIDWAASEIKNILSENTGGIINTAITWGKKLFGGDDYGLYHEGGLVGTTLPHPPSPEDKLAYDEYLAVLQAGEYVMTGDEYKRYKAFMSFIDVLAKSGPGGGGGPPAGMPSAVDTGLVSQSTADFVEAVFAKGILGWKGVVDPDTGKTSYVPQPMSLFNIMPFLTDLPTTLITSLLDVTLAKIGVEKPTITSFLDYVLEAVGLGPQGSSGNIGSGFAFGTGEYGGYEGAMGGTAGSSPGVGEGGDSMGYATGGIVPYTQMARVHGGEGIFTPSQMKHLQPSGSTDDLIYYLKKMAERPIKVYLNGKEIATAVTQAFDQGEVLWGRA